MVEWQNGNGGIGRMAETRNGYIPDLPDIFTEHADDDDPDTFKSFIV
jgi:hypothetical protein